MSFALRRTLSSSTKVTAESESTDLDAVWGSDIISSPIVQRSANIPIDFFDLLLENANEASHNTPQRKILHCAPQPAKVVLPEIKEKAPDFIYRRVTMTSDQPLSIPESYEEQYTFVFNQMENQTEAWDSFKRKMGTSKYGLVSCMNTAFFFHDGQILAKGVTGTAQKRLQALSDNLPNIEIDKVFDFIETVIGKEKLELYLLVPFANSTATPISLKTTQINSANGKRYRIAIAGNIFAPDCEWLVNQNGGARTVSTDRSMIF